MSGSRIRIAGQLFALTLSVSVAQAQTIAGGAVDAADPRAAPFLAIPNDGEDDRESLQRWIDAGCASPNKLLYLPPGDWHVTRRPGVGLPTIGSLRITCDGLTIIGAGRGSRIVMKGSALSPENLKATRDWIAVEILANRVTLEAMAIDGARRSNTGEQTHLIQISGPARDTELRRLYLNLPALFNPPDSVKCKPGDEDPEFHTRMCEVPGHGNTLCKELNHQPRCSFVDGVYTVLGWFQGGDCVRSLGRDGPVDGVSLTDSYGSQCDRAFISFQRNSSNFTITGNVTRMVTDQIIDLEPSGEGGVGKVIIIGNRLERGGAAAQGAAAISLAGPKVNAGISESILISGNLLDGGIFTKNVARISIEHNVINGQPSAGSPVSVVRIENHTDSLRLIGNEIDRPVGAGAGAVVLVSADDAGRPKDVTIALNTIRQHTDGNVIHLAGTQNVTIAANTLLCNQPTENAHAAIRGVARTVSIARLIVSQNRARGACESLLHLVDSPSVGAVTVTDNQTAGLNFGVRFTNVLHAIIPRISDNLFEGMPPANFVTGPPSLVFNGENGPVP